MTDWIIREASAEDAAAVAELGVKPLQGSTSAGDWLLAAERDGVVRACIRIRIGIGRDAPRYWWHVGRVVHAAPELQLFHEQRTLFLNNDYTGAIELSDLRYDAALDAASRDALLRRLVRASLLLVARERGRRADLRGDIDVIAELPGVRDASGAAPFWESLGRRFYDGEPQEAAARFGPVWRSYVAALLPRDPLIASFLSEAAQAAIGAAAPESEAQREALSAEGLRFDRYVTIDDAGPVLANALDALTAVDEAQACTVRAGQLSGQARSWLALHQTQRRIALVEGVLEGGTLTVAPERLRLVNLREGATLWVTPSASGRE